MGMTSDIDELLADLRGAERRLRIKAAHYAGHRDGNIYTHDADRNARYAAAVEELRDRASLVIGHHASATANEDAWLYAPERTKQDA